MSALYYLLHNDVNISFIYQRAFFCWPHQLELPAAFLLLAACVLVAGGAGCWLVPSSTGAHWCLRSRVYVR
jgi:hypothetical protein